MKITKAKNRDKKRQKRNKMVVDSKSVFLIQQQIIRRSVKKSLEKSLKENAKVWSELSKK